MLTLLVFSGRMKISRIKYFGINTALQLILLLSPFYSMGKRNVIILYPEDMGNHMGSLGTTGISTPVLDNLALKGVQFTANFCAQTVCSPTKGAFYTGRMPHDNGLIRNVNNFPVDKLPIPLNEDPSDMQLTYVKEDVPTLIEILKQAGYFTAITSKTHVQPMRKFRFDYGWGAINAKGIDKPKTWTGFIDTLKAKAGDQPFFLMANTALTHAPWQRKLIDNEISSDPTDRLAPPTSVDWKKIPVHPFLPDTEKSRKDLARYFSMIQVVDSWAGVLLDDLEKSGLVDSTLVIFTPDHGMPYQRGKVACYPAGTRVPLIIVGPGVKKGVEIKAPVSNIDLMATILEFLKIPKPEGMSGRSLWPMLKGEVTEFSDRKTVMMETNSYYKGRAVCDGRWYYIRNFTQPENGKPGDDPWLNPPMNIDLWMANHKFYDNQVFSETSRVKNEQPLPYKLLAEIVEGRLPEEELYDLEQDPWAVNNLANDGKFKEILLQMKAELNAWQVKTNDEVLDFIKQ